MYLLLDEYAQWHKIHEQQLDLKQMQMYVKGLIERVLGCTCLACRNIDMWVNEEGIHDMQITMCIDYTQKNTVYRTFLHGPILFSKYSESNECEKLDEEDIAYILSLFKEVLFIHDQISIVQYLRV